MKWYQTDEAPLLVALTEIGHGDEIESLWDSPFPAPSADEVERFRLECEVTKGPSPDDEYVERTTWYHPTLGIALYVDDDPAGDGFGKWGRHSPNGSSSRAPST